MAGNWAQRGHSLDESRDHEIEPEDVQAEEATQKGVEHVQGTILHVLAHTVVALFLETPNHMDGEEPQTEVYPAHNHQSVEDICDRHGENIDCQLEKCNCQIGNIM